MNNLGCPCKYCAERYEACHDTCKGFIAYNNQRLSKMALEKNNQRKERDYIDVKINAIWETKKKVFR